jgi:16S rRNA processing protein RimM
MYIAIGKIIKVHGVQGYLRAIPYSGIPDRFLYLKTIYIGTSHEMRGFILEDVVVQEQTSLLKMKGIETREAAVTLLKKELWAPEEQQIDLPEGVYFIHDLIGLKVIDGEGEYLGELVEVLSNAGNDVYVVRKDEGDILIPAVSEFVQEVNLQQQKMVVQLIDGMLE